MTIVDKQREKELWVGRLKSACRGIERNRCDLNRREADVSLKLHHLSLNFNGEEETYVEFFPPNYI